MRYKTKGFVMRKKKDKIEMTDKEEELMRIFWNHGPMFVREIVELYPEPRPHLNTLSTFVRNLEQKGFVSHEAVGGSFRYYAVARKEDFRRKTLGTLIKNYFGNSYFGAVSTLVEEEKISVDELKELIDMVENKNKDK